MKTCFLSVDVEKRERQKNKPFEGVDNLDNILNILKKHNAKATLFITGEVLEYVPDLVKEWSENFEIGCHNYNHITLDKLDFRERERQIRDFVGLYRDIFEKSPKGFRAPRNIINNEQFRILEKYEFLYDSSVIPRYPWPVCRYEGYKGRAPLLPYLPSKKDYRKSGDLEILEIPESPVFFVIPFSGTWLRKLGVTVFKTIIRFVKPKFISFSMHSWDGVKFEGGKNSGEKFLKQLDEILKFLKEIGYEFKNGEQIYEQFSKNR